MRLRVTRSVQVIAESGDQHDWRKIFTISENRDGVDGHAQTPGVHRGGLREVMEIRQHVEFELLILVAAGKYRQAISRSSVIVDGAHRDRRECRAAAG